ncbi:unnamed protein product [Ectocarpus fasciculatus]
MFPKVIVDGLRTGSFKNIVVLAGAGCSVSSGIPDFRSPGGFYDSLRPELITATPDEQSAMSMEPSLVVDINMFKRNQFPYLEVRRPFILGTIDKKWKPTLTHFFFKLLDDKGMLRRIYTQNIDGLDYHTGIPQERVVSVHGSINTMSCEGCKTPYPTDEFGEALISSIKNIYDPSDSDAPSVSKPIPCKSCGEPMVKPDTVLFGTSLPERFFESSAEDFPDHADLLLIVGTSLVVSPANQLVRRVAGKTMRAVVNLEPVGMGEGLDYEWELNGVKRDYLISSYSDEAFLGLAKDLGWTAELGAYYDQMAPSSQELLSTISQS